MNFYISQLDENKKIIPIIAGNEYFSRSLPTGSVPKIS